MVADTLTLLFPPAKIVIILKFVVLLCMDKAAKTCLGVRDWSGAINAVRLSIGVESMKLQGMPRKQAEEFCDALDLALFLSTLK